MDKDEKNLFQACKIGDLARVKQLVEKEDIELNVRDKWDSTPLYYACLCGHIDLVKYLLENGAKCEANTFDGERCRYGALTDQIRQLLRTSTVATVRLDQYELFLERLFELGSYSDIVFEINGRSLCKLHKSILAARSDYFRAKFEGVWRNRTWVEAKNELLVPEAFESVVRYIYTDRFSTLKVHFEACLRLCKLFKLRKLLDKFNRNLYFLNRESQAANNVEGGGETGDDEVVFKMSQFDVNAPKKPDSIQLTINDTDIFLIGKFGTNSKLSTTITIESSYYGHEASELSADMRQLALSTLPKDIEWEDGELMKNSTDERKNLDTIVDVTHDLCLNLDDCSFRVHKLFLAERCEYFRAFLHDPFNETRHHLNPSSSTSRKSNVAELQLKQVSPEVLREIVFFLYSNDFSRPKLDESILFEVLLVADLYLLPSLKRKCASELVNHHLTGENLFDMFRISRLYDLKKLEFACISYLADNLSKFERSEQLRELIVEDAKNLKSRQETDTIDIVDDLRYAINEINMQQTNASLIDREVKLHLIDKILRELNLEC